MIILRTIQITTKMSVKNRQTNIKVDIGDEPREIIYVFCNLWSFSRRLFQDAMRMYVMMSTKNIIALFRYIFFAFWTFYNFVRIVQLKKPSIFKAEKYFNFSSNFQTFLCCISIFNAYINFCFRKEVLCLFLFCFLK